MNAETLFRNRTNPLTHVTSTAVSTPCALYSRYQMTVPRASKLVFFEDRNTGLDQPVQHWAWKFERLGPIPKGMKVVPVCGDMRCVNPDHLALAPTDPDDPVWDAEPKIDRRQKLSDAEVAEIRQSACTAAELARLFGVSEDHVGRIRRGELRRGRKQ